jgi:RHS repeat-associated protein
VHSCGLRTSRFTGKERDTESGLDYFGARYYASNTGRWMSPDWSAKQEAVPYSKLEDPQTLNLYGYLTNNPLSMTDADGHGPWWDLAKKTFHDAVTTARTVKVTVEVGYGLEVKGHLGNLKAEAGANVHGEVSTGDPVFSVKAEAAVKGGIGPLKVGGGVSMTSKVQSDGSLSEPVIQRDGPKIEMSGDRAAGGTFAPDQVSIGGAAYEGIGGGANVGVDPAPFHELEGDVFQAIQNASPNWVKVKSSDPQPKPDTPQ